MFGPESLFLTSQITHTTITAMAPTEAAVVLPTAGYVTFGITMGIYSHVMPNMQKDAVANFIIAADPVR